MYQLLPTVWKKKEENTIRPRQVIRLYDGIARRYHYYYYRSVLNKLNAKRSKKVRPVSEPTRVDVQHFLEEDESSGSLGSPRGLQEPTS
jgi:hypothetical protein